MMQLGPISIQVGGMLVKRGRFKIPDGLHVWVGSRGLHAYWAHSPYQRRVTLDREVPKAA